MLLLAACGGSGEPSASRTTVADTLAAVEGLSGAEREQKLAQLAADQGGGALTVYTSSTLSYMEQLGDEFEDAYDLDVAIYKTTSDALAPRLLEESEAGFRGSDVVETNIPTLVVLDGEGILEPYDSPRLAGLVQGSKGKAWIGDKANTFVVAWNTDRVAEGEAPTSFEDLADPKWKGRVALEADDSDWFKTLWEHLVDGGNSPEEVDRLFSGIAANATFVNGHQLMLQLVAAGEFDVTVNAYLHNVKELQAEGAPLDWQPAVEPLISKPDGIAVVEEARNPAAALLFVDFVLGRGQEIFAEASLTPTRKDLGVPPTIEQISMDVPDYVAHADEWVQRYEDLVRLGELRPDSD